MRPSISIIIPVLHEAPIINGLIGHLMRLPFDGKLEILVVDGAPSGDSLQAIQAAQVKKIFADQGRGIQMNTGARKASGDILLFLHADTRLPPNGLVHVAKALDGSSAVGGAFDLSIDSPRPCFRWIEKTASLRSRITRIPYGDQAVFIRRDFFLELGGFGAFPIMEDVELMGRIKKSGHRIVLLSSRVKTSARRWESAGVCRNTLRNWMMLALFYLGTPPERLYRFYR